MSFTQHLGPILKGAGVGFIFGLASIATADRKLLSVLAILNIPVQAVMWLGQKVFGWGDATIALTGWFLLGIYWMIIGGLIGWGFGVVRARALGDE